MQGSFEIKDGSTWRRVVEKNWNEKRQKMLCQHLGFEEMNGNIIETKQLETELQIAAGDLICYNTQSSRTSCCVHLEPSTSTTSITIPYTRCKYTACVQRAGIFYKALCIYYQNGWIG